VKILHEVLGGLLFLTHTVDDVVSWGWKIQIQNRCTR